MSAPKDIFCEIGDQIANVEQSQMFGKLCYKTNSKAFICFFQDCMVFKLAGEHHATALALTGSKLFDPSGKGRPMKEWVQVSYNHQDHWTNFALAAHNYVGQG